LLPLLPGVIFASRYRVVRMLGRGAWAGATWWTTWNPMKGACLRS
jgi:hypothetical protein